MLEIIDHNKIESIFPTLIDCRILQRNAVFVVLNHTLRVWETSSSPSATMIVTFGRFLLSAAPCSCESSRPCSSQTEASALPRPAGTSAQDQGASQLKIDKNQEGW